MAWLTNTKTHGKFNTDWKDPRSRFSTKDVGYGTRLHLGGWQHRDFPTDDEATEYMRQLEEDEDRRQDQIEYNRQQSAQKAAEQIQQDEDKRKSLESDIRRVQDRIRACEYDLQDPSASQREKANARRELNRLRNQENDLNDKLRQFGGR